jgi:ribonuclease R
MPSKESPQPLKQLITNEIMQVVNASPNKTFNYKQLAKLLGVSDRSGKTLMVTILADLKDRGVLVEPERGKYKLKPKRAYVTGTIDITSLGFAYVKAEEFTEEIYISEKNVNNSLQGDLVSVYVYAKRKNGRPEGEVVEIAQRKRVDFVGTVQLSDKFAFLVPDDSKMSVDIFIPLQHLNGAKDGQKAVATIDEWPKGTKNPIGRIKEVLGWPGENEAEMNAILIEYGFETSFPKKVEAEAEAIPFEIAATEIAKRRDFRNITTFTIDPFDAKDFDDALSVRKINEDLWEIGVHIADVSHYIREDSALEEEAYKRATSIYLVDRVVPMLPEKLSNNVCSLRPNEDKLCFSAVFEMDASGTISSEWFGRTVICSDKRFTYEEAQMVIETEEGPLKEEILLLDGLAKKLRAERFKKGAIGFDRLEVKFHLDEQGRPTGVYTKEAKDANKLIEEFMLLANRKVSEFIGKVRNGKTARTFVYRVHDKPVVDRLTTFSAFAAKFGYKLDLKSDSSVSSSLNKLMKDLEGKKEQNVLEQLAIRTMAKAKYTTQNIGHYGLAFEYYTHFTSPIRRYPDVMVHRLLQRYLDGGTSVGAEEYEEKCKHSTDMEIQAASAERDSVKYKQVEFLKDKVGQIFDGMISGLTDWGMFVELNENKCEGLVRLRDMQDDHYDFDEANYCIVGRRTGRRFQLGDTVTIRIKSADLFKKQLTFELIQSGATPSIEHEFGFAVSSQKRNAPTKRKR